MNETLLVHPSGVGALWLHVEMPEGRLMRIEDTLWEIRRRQLLEQIREHLD